ncbi:hypothetical protein LXA43DRAFT_893730 [Ganoderma leucocontextum]|nr:hypothetical protein LXA43DRAFT_893730 [Ganoderma leucocontextum]
MSGLQDDSYIAEQSSGNRCVLALRPIDAQNVEEAVLRVQGFIIEACLPPVRQFKLVFVIQLRISAYLSCCTSIPRNLNRLINLQQSITLTGLGTKSFDAAVCGVQTVYQVFNNHVSRTGGRLREWTPGRCGQDLTLTFTNCYLTSSHDLGDEASVDLSAMVDPFNVLRPLIKSEVHTADNVVEYWERRQGGDSSKEYAEIKPGLFMLTNLVEVQVSFVIVRVARQEHVFVPKLRAICLLDCDYNLSVICCLASGQLSPLKKVKRKVGYGTPSSDESSNDDVHPPPNKQLRGLNLDELGGEVERTDVPMKDLA